MVIKFFLSTHSNNSSSTVSASDMSMSNILCIAASRLSFTARSSQGANLYANAIKSAARPDPSHTTTGTGGESVTYSSTERIVCIPPSITTHTKGMEQCVRTGNSWPDMYFSSFRLSAQCSDVTQPSICRNSFTLRETQLRNGRRFRCPPKGNKRADC